MFWSNICRWTKFPGHWIYEENLSWRRWTLSTELASSYFSPSSLLSAQSLRLLDFQICRSWGRRTWSANLAPYSSPVCSGPPKLSPCKNCRQDSSFENILVFYTFDVRITFVFSSLVWRWVGGRSQLTWTAWYQAGDIKSWWYLANDDTRQMKIPGRWYQELMIPCKWWY